MFDFVSQQRFCSRAAAVTLALAGLLYPMAASAQTTTPPNVDVPVKRMPPTVGSLNPVSAEPLVSRPATKPCVVHLFHNEQFDDYSDHDSTYTPPADCPGPWAKVVFSANFNVTAGIQFDRSTKFFIGGANVFFGTTAEPDSTLSPSWHVERDLTDLSTLLSTTQPVVLSLYNIYGEDGGTNYNGSITGSADLLFYPVAANATPPVVPDAVLPLDPAGAATMLNSTSDQLARTFTTLPRNIEKAYLQVFAQSQSADEFWYTCSPNSVAAALDGNCGNTAFRETEIYIDGKAAGIAPVYPWIYTGGLDPTLWQPIVGIQTLDFKPFLVDLTPFAGVLSDGAQHTVAVSVYNADSGFDVTGTLLLYLDHGASRVTGDVTENTLDQAPTPYVSAPKPKTVNGITSETSYVTSLRGFRLSGYVNTSHGRVVTTLDETVNFGNVSKIAFEGQTYYNQQLTQVTGTVVDTRQQVGPLVNTWHKELNYPLSLSFYYNQSASGAIAENVSVDQQRNVKERNTLLGVPVLTSTTKEEVSTKDAAAVSAAGAYTDNASSHSNYSFQNSNGGCYNTTLASTNGVLTSVQNGNGCPGGVNTRP